MNDNVLLTTTVGSLQSRITAAQTTLTSVCAAVNGQTLPVLGTLPVVGNVAGLLTATLTDACP